MPSIPQMTLSRLVDIRAGYPFRGAIPEVVSGQVKAVQAKDISDFGELLTGNLITTELTGKRAADWLQQGDLLFISKGMRHLACSVMQPLVQTTLAPSLYLLRIKPEHRERLNPEFLCWQINQTPVQRYFRNSAEGSHQVSIRKPVLAATPVAVPGIEIQNRIARFYAASLRENALLRGLIENRQRQLSAIAQDLMSSSTVSSRAQE